MTPTALLADLEAAGVSLTPAGDDLRYQTRPGVSIVPYADRIRQDKPALLTELRLREQIIATLDVDPQDFNREEYDHIWVLWHAQDAREESTP